MSSNGRVVVEMREWQERENVRLLWISCALIAVLVIPLHWSFPAGVPRDDLTLRIIDTVGAVLILAGLAISTTIRRAAPTVHGLFLLLLFTTIAALLVQTGDDPSREIGMILTIFAMALFAGNATAFFVASAGAFVFQLMYSATAIGPTPANMRTVAMSLAAYLIANVFVSTHLRTRRSQALSQFREIMLLDRQIDFLRYYDAVTSLPNRNRLIERLAREPSQMSRFALIAINVAVASGAPGSSSPFDAIMRAVAGRLRVALPPHNELYRGAGHDLLVLSTREQDAQDLARQIFETMAAPLETLGPDTYAKLSIATHVFARGDDATSVLDDIESVFTKDANAIVSLVRRTESDPRLVRFQRLQRDLAGAIKNEQFKLYFQPYVDSTGTVAGAEALIRWNHPELGLLLPAEFIGIAEQDMSIIALGDWVLYEAARDAAAFSQRHLDLPVAINVSSKQFVDKMFLSSVRGAIAEAGVDPGLLTLEITESVAMEDVSLSRSRLNECKAMGIHIALDDFGTGYSSLSYLRALPVDVIKIDKSFVRSLPAERDASEIVRAIIALGHSIERRVQAEGVENETQFAWLARASCDLFQGHYVTAPLPIEDLLKWKPQVQVGLA